MSAESVLALLVVVVVVEAVWAVVLGVVFLLLSVGTLVGLALTRQGRALLRVPTKGIKK